MANKHTDFWRKLLKFGDTEDERRKYWNHYCYWKCERTILTLLDLDERQNVKKRLAFSDDPDNTANIRKRLQAFIQQQGGDPPLPSALSSSHQSFMDFSGTTFDDDAMFGGRILIGADFQNCVFSERLYFDGTEFIGKAAFDYTECYERGKHWYRVASFKNSAFHHEVSFSHVIFPLVVDFSNSMFGEEVQFQLAKFGPIFQSNGELAVAIFHQSRFLGSAGFSGVSFGANAVFKEAEFSKSANFWGTTFNKGALFTNSRFRSEITFRGATFRLPPEFFETELHEDVDFNGVDWRKSEVSYRQLQRPNYQTRRPADEVESQLDHAIRSWDRLTLIMSQRERLGERHEFFRLKMRAQRQRDGFSSLSVLNWLFDKSSDYGWGVGRALVCWSGQVVLGGVVLSGLASNCFGDSTSGSQLGLEIVLDGLFLSFANSHAFLRLASTNGWVHGSREAIVGSCEASSLVNYIGYVGVAQAILGPILLFLVLLTLRNRFRLG